MRANDYPSFKTINVNYQKYFIPIRESDLQFVFYKSKITGRWWVSSCMEFDKETNYKEQITPCSYEDYLNTLSDFSYLVFGINHYQNLKIYELKLV